MIPSEFAQKVLSSCPPGFASGIFEDTGIEKREVGIEGTAPVCFMRKEDPTRTDIIVFSKDLLVYEAGDR